MCIFCPKTSPRGFHEKSQHFENTTLFPVGLQSIHPQSAILGRGFSGYPPCSFFFHLADHAFPTPPLTKSVIWFIFGLAVAFGHSRSECYQSGCILTAAVGARIPIKGKQPFAFGCSRGRPWLRPNEYLSHGTPRQEHGRGPWDVKRSALVCFYH